MVPSSQKIVKMEMLEKQKIILPKINPTSTQAWFLLKKHFEQEMSRKHMTTLFAEDTDRWKNFSIHFNDILFDYSKNIINKKTLTLLLQLASECNLKAAINNLFSGAKINETENKPALHTALRNFSNNKICVDNEDIMPSVQHMRQRMQQFCEQVHNGTFIGFTGKPITYIVNIGIGGSDLGPLMVTEALSPYCVKGITTYFVSNADGTNITETLKKIDPERTLFLVASKTFTTQETIANAYTAKTLFLAYAKSEENFNNHFVALTANKNEALQFGIQEDKIFQFWDWVGGRYSLWSAVGLSIALTIGYKNFELLLKGAYEVDQHFTTQSFDTNIPVIMALLSIWYTNFFGAQTEAILPYDDYLHKFPAYLQQVTMESNGKNIDRNGNLINYTTSPVVWGAIGTNAQHAFYQLIHQGSFMVPCDFIAPAITHNPINDHHIMLLSHFFGQTEALMNGKSENDVAIEMIKEKKNDVDIKKVVSFKTFHGNKPTNSFLLKQITPHTLGSLIALYEHKIFVQGVIYNIFSFDQWGVDLGKQVAHKIVAELKGNTIVDNHDSSTNGLIHTFKMFNKNIAN